MAESLPIRKRPPLKKLFLQKGGCSFDAGLEDTRLSYLLWWVVRKIVSLALRDVPNVVGARGNWLNRVQVSPLGASDTAKRCHWGAAVAHFKSLPFLYLLKYGSYTQILKTFFTVVEKIHRYDRP